ncbi:MAG: hypothetical protein ACRYG7_45595 [Janthinobacterium lividum]
MTRATLLQLLAQPATLTGAEVRALEELAETFPYCQTAHLLLAKAAHDQGSMLAGQRLRRAATYAADRTLLRQLIELPVPAVPLAAVASTPVAAPDDTSTFIPVVSSEGNDTQITELLIDTPEQVLEPLVFEEVAPLAEEELPAQAPPVRPPVEAVVASTEFGLADSSPAEIIAYQLPTLAEPTAEALAPAATTPALPPFEGLVDVGYGFGEGSRLGYCLLPLAGTEILATRLPTSDEFFAPDALVLAHLAAQQPALSKARPLDLIDSFLRRAPAVQRRRTPPTPDDEAQADLSVRSTRAEPDLASESLAKILGRQGKHERAIAIYERLMVKHPEKIAYFAAQIDSLRTSA